MFHTTCPYVEASLDLFCTASCRLATYSIENNASPRQHRGPAKPFSNDLQLYPSREMLSVKAAVSTLALTASLSSAIFIVHSVGNKLRPVLMGVSVGADLLSVLLAHACIGQWTGETKVGILSLVEMIQHTLLLIGRGGSLAEQPLEDCWLLVVPSEGRALTSSRTRHYRRRIGCFNTWRVC